MQPVQQTRTGSTGNCFAACIASLLEIPLKLVDGLHEDTINGFLKRYGLHYHEIKASKNFPQGKYIVCGRSPRGGLHACIGEGGKIIFDPHPKDGTGRGLVTVNTFGLLEPVKDHRERLHRSLDKLLDGHRWRQR